MTDVIRDHAMNFIQGAVAENKVRDTIISVGTTRPHFHLTLSRVFH